MPDNDKIIWVVNCVHRKTIQSDQEMSISNYSSNPNSLLRNWIARISKPKSNLRAAVDLYAGANWNIVKNTISQLPQIELWIVSAGYGLIRSDTEIESYQATFQSDSDNYVGKDYEESGIYDSDQVWWSKLNEWKGPVEEMERSFKSLLLNNPDTPIMISLSRKYFNAVSNDLKTAIEHFPQREKLFLLASGTLPERLVPFHIPIHSRYTRKFNNTTYTINFRTASEILTNFDSHKFDFPTVRQIIAKDFETLSDLETYKRKPGTDSEILKIIDDLKKVTPNHSHSRLLRIFRDHGYACEQSRFRDLYNQSSDISSN